MAVLEGSEEFIRALRSLPVDIQSKVLRKSAISGARIVRDRIKALAPVAAAAVKRRGGAVTAPGTLQRAVVLKFAPEKSNGDQQTYVVAVRHGKRFQKSNRDAFYWLWVEQGHRVVGRSGRVIGQAAPHPFFVPGYRATAGQARDQMKATMGNALSSAITAAGLRNS